MIQPLQGIFSGRIFFSPRGGGGVSPPVMPQPTAVPENPVLNRYLAPSATIDITPLSSRSGRCQVPIEDRGILRPRTSTLPAALLGGVMACAPRLAEALDLPPSLATSGVLPPFVVWGLAALSVVALSIALGFLWGRRGHASAVLPHVQPPVEPEPPPLHDAPPIAPRTRPVEASPTDATADRPPPRPLESPSTVVPRLRILPVVAPAPAADPQRPTDTVHDLSGSPHASIADGDGDALFALRKKFGKNSTILYILVRQENGAVALWASNVRMASYEGLLRLANKQTPVTLVAAGRIGTIDRKALQIDITMDGRAGQLLPHAGMLFDVVKALRDAQTVVDSFVEAAAAPLRAAAEARAHEREARMVAATVAEPRPVAPQQVLSDDEALAQQLADRKLHRIQTTAQFGSLFGSRPRETNFIVVRTAVGNMELRVPQQDREQDKRMTLCERKERIVGGGTTVIDSLHPGGMTLFYDGFSSSFRMMDDGLETRKLLPAWIDAEAGFGTVDRLLREWAGLGIRVQRVARARLEDLRALRSKKSDGPVGYEVLSTPDSHVRRRKLSPHLLVPSNEAAGLTKIAGIAAAGYMGSLDVYQLGARSGWGEIAEWLEQAALMQGVSFAFVAMPCGWAMRVARGVVMVPEHLGLGARAMLLHGDVTSARTLHADVGPTIEVFVANLVAAHSVTVSDAVKQWVDFLAKMAGNVVLSLQLRTPDSPRLETRRIECVGI